MRMWNVNPKIMCRQHLLGEHLEMHMFRGAIKFGQKLAGYEKGLLARGSVKKRHDILASEMRRRGYNHKSAMRKFAEGKGGFVRSRENLKVLAGRCKECRKIQNIIV